MSLRITVLSCFLALTSFELAFAKGPCDKSELCRRLTAEEVGVLEAKTAQLKEAISKVDPKWVLNMEHDGDDTEKALIREGRKSIANKMPAWHWQKLTTADRKSRGMCIGGDNGCFPDGMRVSLSFGVISSEEIWELGADKKIKKQFDEAIRMVDSAKSREEADAIRQKIGVDPAYAQIHLWWKELSTGFIVSAEALSTPAFQCVVNGQNSETRIKRTGAVAEVIEQDPSVLIYEHVYDDGSQLKIDRVAVIGARSCDERAEQTLMPTVPSKLLSPVQAVTIHVRGSPVEDVRDYFERLDLEKIKSVLDSPKH